MNYQEFIIDPKDAQRILFGAGGKLGPMEFAQGLVAIIAVSLAFSLLSLIPGLGVLISVLGLIVGLVLAFAWVCIFSKRFHDAGQSGWMTLAAIAVAVVLSIVVGLHANHGRRDGREKHDHQHSRQWRAGILHVQAEAGPALTPGISAGSQHTQPHPG